MIPGDHSGLKDDGWRIRTKHRPLIGYDSGGRNDAWMAAVSGAGIKYVASDSSQPGQGEEKYDPSGKILLVPRRPSERLLQRHPAGNVQRSNPTAGVLGDLVSEYN